MTVWRSDFEWTPAAKFLAVAIISWLVAGLQGLINATIAFDVVVHNTMWIVGHFHNMALLNIGLVIFAAVYAFLPRLVNRQWYSESPRQRPPVADRDRRLRHGAADARAGPRGRTAALRGAALRVRRVDPADDPVRGDGCPRPGRVRVQPHPDAARQGPPAPGDGAALARLHRVARRRRGGPRRHGARAKPRGRGREAGEAGARRHRRQVRHGRRGALRSDLRQLPQPQVGWHDRQRGAGPRQAPTRRRARADGDRAGRRRQRHDAARAPARRGRKARIGLRRPGRGQVAIAADPASERLALAAAGLSLGAALIHASVTAAHFREYWLFGLLFAIVAPLQLAWAELVRRRPRDRRLLAVGALGNGAVAAVWIASRTTGLPIGPNPGESEPLGVKDVLATADELVCAAIVAVLLARAAVR